MKCSIYFDGGHTPYYEARVLDRVRTHFSHPIRVRPFNKDNGDAGYTERFKYGHEHGKFDLVKNSIWVSMKLDLMHDGSTWIPRAGETNAPKWAKDTLDDMMGELTMRVFRRIPVYRDYSDEKTKHTYYQHPENGPNVLVNDQNEITHAHTRGLRTHKLMEIDPSFYTEDLRWVDSQIEYLVRDT